MTEKIQQLTERKDRYGELMEEMEAQGEKQVSLTDPDSRSMPKSPRVDAGFNVQMAVDDKHKLIVEQEVTNAVTDDDQLSGIAIRAKGTLGVNHVNVVADMGYYHGHEIKTCEKEGIEPYVSKPLTSANRKLGLYGKEKFAYDPDKDRYICPRGQELLYRFETTELGRRIRYYTTTACRNCKIKEQCTRNKAGRRITRWVHEQILERMQERVTISNMSYLQFPPHQTRHIVFLFRDFLLASPHGLLRLSTCQRFKTLRENMQKHVPTPGRKIFPVVLINDL